MREETLRLSEPLIGKRLTSLLFFIFSPTGDLSKGTEMLHLSEDTLLQIQEAGFKPCLVGDIANGDTILIDHSLNRDFSKPMSEHRPTEMMVTKLRGHTVTVWESNETNTIFHWVGVLSNGLEIHCSYSCYYDCWKHHAS